jgi:cytochrome c peroxidase
MDTATPRIAALAALLLSLAACGGGGGGTTTVAQAAAPAPAPPVAATPTLPATPFGYADADIGLPAQFRAGAGGPTPAPLDNTPPDNPVTNAGATLGRVLFYDKRLSVNDTVSCGSCHRQATGFADPARFSLGFQGGRTPRHSMGLANARYYARGRFFWDERAATLEAQVLQPIQDSVEMGMTLPQLTAKLGAVGFYGPLFTAAFGDATVTSDRIARALAQFVRAMVSYRSKFDSAFTNGIPNFAATFTPAELQGQQIFNGRGRCAQCHTTLAHSGDGIRNNGLDLVTVDAGAGNARFKVPSLRNIAVRAPFMHDGRFGTLREVVDFYDNGVQPHPNLDPRLQGPGGTPLRLNLTPVEKDALEAFLRTLTDDALLADPKFSDPFPR